MSAATSARPPSELLAIITDTDNPKRWETYLGPAPAGAPKDSAGAPIKFVTVWPTYPDPLAEGLASEDFGQLREQWQLTITGTTIDEVRWLRSHLLGLDWGTRWEFVASASSGVNEQEYADPSLWQASIVMRDIEVGTWPAP